MNMFCFTNNAACSAIIIIIVVWFSVALFPCNAQVTFREIGPYNRDHVHVPVYSTDLSSPEDESLDGYISLKDFEWISDQNHRDDLKKTVDRAPSKRPAVIPQCIYDTYIYDPIANKCGEHCTRAHCGENMLLSWSNDYPYYGECECRTSCITPCWDKPFFLTKDRCYRLNDRGPCPAGQVLVPMDRYSLKCGRDACLRSGPMNAVNFSSWSLEGADGNNAKPFLFTYKNECYMTETEAFCKPGKVARFLEPYKSPSCVPRDNNACVLAGSTSPSIKIPCKSGFVEDTAKNLCMSPIGVEFE